jgi:hypothetical protein
MTILDVKTWLHERLAAYPVVENITLTVEPGKYVADDKDGIPPLVREQKTLRWGSIGRRRGWRGDDGQPMES